MEQDVLFAIGDRDSSSAGRTFPGVVVGILLGFDEYGGALVDYPGNPAGAGIQARAVPVLYSDDCGREAVLVFENCDPERPIIVGLLHPVDHRPVKVVAEVDEQNIEITAKNRITLRCGEASITLTRSGKVLIRGKYLLSRSSGVNMVQGGSVRLN